MGIARTLGGMVFDLLKILTTEMATHDLIKLFDGTKIRVVWDDKQEKYYFSVVDVVSVLTDSVNPTDYLKKMRKRDPELAEGWGQIVTPLAYRTMGGPQTSSYKGGSRTSYNL